MNPIMQPIINKYVVLYVAHPFGGNLDNIARAEIQLSKLRKLLPRHTLISPIHNWSYLDYESAGCRAEYIAAKVKGLPVFTFSNNDLQRI